jgi:hypothetical protein
VNDQTKQGRRKGSTFDKIRLFLSLMKWYAVLLLVREKKRYFCLSKKRENGNRNKCKEKFKWYVLKEKTYLGALNERMSD